MLNHVRECAARVFLSLILLGHLGQARATTPPTANILDRRVSINIASTDPHMVLSELAGKHNIPIGFEAASRAESPAVRKNSFDVEKRPLREVLDALTAANPAYRWELTGGVINVFPNEGREELLDVIVNKFTIPLKTSRIGARQSITELPEVKNLLERAGLRPLHATLSSADTGEISPGFSADWSNVTVRHILNDIARRSDSHYWVVSRYGARGEFLIINF